MLLPAEVKSYVGYAQACVRNRNAQHSSMKTCVETAVALQRKSGLQILDKSKNCPKP